MAGPSSNPRGEHTPRPGTTWNTELTTTGEVLVLDGPWDGPATVTNWHDAPTPRPNRATRRAAARANRRRTR